MFREENKISKKLGIAGPLPMILILLGVIALAFFVVGRSSKPERSITPSDTVPNNVEAPETVPGIKTQTGVTEPGVKPQQTQPTSPTKLSYYLNLPEPETYTITYIGTKGYRNLTVYKDGTKTRLDERFGPGSVGALKERRQIGLSSSGYLCEIQDAPLANWRCAVTPNRCGDPVYSYGRTFDRTIFTEPFPVTSPYQFNKGYVGKERIAGVDASCFELQLESNFIGFYGPTAKVCFHPTKYLVLRDLNHVASSLLLGSISDSTFDPPQPEAEHSKDGFCAFGN